ncbi:hypothetical protein PHLCEN_2v4640 [Hermanssonia centrifuga]|uniref:Uncharacterized protein n=1 Tax=Hermanssonia centrifuga TaxID=98765 RepID=A0A2R6PMU8_9APHY|nr:hypothetical protein PHLCEN_2v4640 [Hermanssonia centrifuga]
MSEPKDIDMNASGLSTPNNILPGGSGPSVNDGVVAQAMSSDPPVSYLPSEHNASNPMTDLVDAIDGMYRILDLMSEQGSGGLIDKIIIAQESFGRFVNDTCPGAYQSMTQVKFDALDALSIKPLGIYGSKEEIARYLRDVGAVSEAIALSLLGNKVDASRSMSSGQRILRSGLYLLRDAAQDLVYAIYWPEDSTWDDDAVSSVQRNRVTFMRYLTKITDQVVALISEKHANSIVWAEESQDASMDVDTDDESDRLFTFQVAKTHEQEENVQCRTGFKIHDMKINNPLTADDPSIDPATLAPRLVQGEGAIGFMNSTYIPAHEALRQINEIQAPFALRQFIERASFRLSDSLSESAFDILLKYDLGRRVPAAFETLKGHRRSVNQASQVAWKNKEGEINKELNAGNPLLVAALSKEMADVIVRNFSPLSHDRLLDSKCREADQSQCSELLSNLCGIYPPLGTWRHESISDSKLQSISKKTFTNLKEKLLAMQDAFDSQPDLSEADQRGLVDSIMADNTTRTREGRPQAGIVSRLVGAVKYSLAPSPVFGSQDHQDIQRERVSNVQFLCNLPSLLDKYPILSDIAGDAVNIAHEHFSAQIKTLANKTAQRLEDLRRSEFMKSLELQLEHDKKISLDTSRATFLNNIGDSLVREKHS